MRRPSRLEYSRRAFKMQIYGNVVMNFPFLQTSVQINYFTGDKNVGFTAVDGGCSAISLEDVNPDQGFENFVKDSRL